MKVTCSAFTLVELLVVMAVVGLLAGLSVPAIQKATESGRRSACTSNIKNLTQTLLLYAQQNDGNFPSIVYRGKSWPTCLFEAGLIRAPTAYSENQGKNMFYCPSACSVRKPSLGNWLTYCMNDYAGARDPQVGLQSAFGMKQVRVSAHSKFSLIMDGCWKDGGYAANVNPLDQPPTGAHPPSKDTNSPTLGVNVGFADGHVEMVKKSDIPTDPSKVFWSGQE
jgi:prepilin-type N-terminal cleavage/methylation domain-containing protein/prepilin-type processing-associated H-X9-DG protein